MRLTKHLDIDAVRRLYRRDVPAPVDVLNLINFKDANAYRWYGMLVMPMLKAMGGEVAWIGSHVTSLEGEPQADDLAVIRYPSHRRFLMFALNPYYALVANPQRLKAVRSFQASFTRGPGSLGALKASKWLLVVHHQPGRRVLEAMRGIIEPAGGRLVYSSYETSPIVITKKAHPANTNPLVFKSTALFEFEDQQQCEKAVTPGVLNQLKELAGHISVQLYRRLERKEALPAAFGKRPS